MTSEQKIQEATRVQLQKRVDQLGCELLDNGVSLEVHCPQGAVFGTTFTHMLRFTYGEPQGAWKKAEAYACVLDDLSVGLEPCTDPDCDYCNEEPVE